MPETQTNIFEQMAQEGQKIESADTAEPMTSVGEIDYEKLSNIPIGEKKKYERANLDGQIVTIKKAQLFPANTNEEPITALSNKDKKYYKCSFVVYYETENEDREYYSGVTQFVNDDGSLSDFQFYYDGATNQVADLWRAVAEFKNKDPKELSPREFMAFLNNRPKAKLKWTSVEYLKKTYHKNLVEKFVE